MPSKVESQYIRREHLVLHAATGALFEHHKSISKAKSWSRIFQRANGGLGCGVVRADDGGSTHLKTYRVINDREAKKRAHDYTQITTIKSTGVGPSAAAPVQTKPQLRRAKPQRRRDV